jgi:hypothetical protein
VGLSLSISMGRIVGRAKGEEKETRLCGTDSIPRSPCDEISCYHDALFCLPGYISGEHTHA